MMLFYNAWGESPSPFLDFYDTEGAFTKHISHDDFARYTFSPFALGFSDDGSNVILTGFKTDDLMVFDLQGNIIQKIAGASEAHRAVRKARDTIKRLLEPEEVNARLQRGENTRGIAEFRLIKGGNQGIYAKEGTLYLFELQKDQEEGEDEVH